MDSRQEWFGYYYSLEAVSAFIGRQCEESFSKAKQHELFITWVVAKFLQSRTGSPHVVGFPSLKRAANISLSEAVNGTLVLNDDNFDTVVADVADLKSPIRIQVKRYMRAENADTGSLADFLIKKLSRYGNAPELNVVIHVCQDMKLDLPLLAHIVKSQNLGIRMIILLATPKEGPSPVLWELYPNYTGIVWSPADETHGDEPQA